MLSFGLRIQFFIVYLMLHLLLLDCSQGGRMSFFGVEKNITVAQGETAYFEWRFAGSESDLQGFKWTAYLTVGSRKRLASFWWSKPDGSRKSGFKEKRLYQNRVSASRHGDAVTLAISHVKREDENIYRCVLDFSKSRDVYSPSITLIVAAPFDPPLITSVVAYKSYILLKWDPLQVADKAPIEKYIIYLKEEGKTNAPYNIYETKTNAYNISGLKMNTVYSIRVATYNMAGVGKPSTKKTVKTLYAGVPFAPRVTNAEKSVKSNNLLLKWSEPDNCGYPILKYSIWYKKRGDKWHILDIPGNITLQHAVRLDWGSTYTIGVRAWNIEGQSSLDNSSFIILKVPENTKSTPVTLESGEKSSRCKSCIIVSSVMTVILFILLVFVAVLLCSLCFICLRKRERSPTSQVSYTIRQDERNEQSASENCHVYSELPPCEGK